MKKVFAFAVAFAIFASTQAFAIIGVGAHYITNLGSLGSEKETIDVGSPSSTIRLTRAKEDVLQGLGFKLWIDALPVVDIEGTFNFTATRYSPVLKITDRVSGQSTEIPLEYKPDAPYSMFFDGAAKPIYGLLSGDFSVTYPLDFLPIIRPYAGLGISYIASIPIVDKKFVEGMGPALKNIIESNTTDEAKAAGEIGKDLTKALKNAEYKTGIGGHVMAGVRAKLPVIPIAAYANTKYYFGGNIDKRFTQGAVFEIGGGFAL
jgi:hypothetical protein